MPPFRQGPIVVDRHINGETLMELREIGHGHRVNVVDASYDIPRGARVVHYPGSSAAALEGILSLIPNEGYVDVMHPDPDIPPGDPNGYKAAVAFGKILDEDIVKEGRPYWRYRLAEQQAADVDKGDGSDAELGFYDIANNHGPNTLFVRTIDDLPFACASLVVGHSQRTS